MKTETSKKIVSYLQAQGMASPSELARHLNISTQAVHRQIRQLLKELSIQKLGAPPTTLYKIAERVESFGSLPPPHAEMIAANFSFLSPTGSYLTGVAAFQSWLTTKNLTADYKSLGTAYFKLWNSIYGHSKGRPIDTLSRIESILSELALDSAYISDFYALPQFGKTHLGNLVHILKTSFKQKFLEQLTLEVADDIQKCIELFKIDAVIFYPHSIARKYQFLPSLQRKLGLNLPTIKVRKIFYDNIPVAQKSLSKIQERIENARKTIFIEPFSFKPKNVLIIDDAIGSGASVNELAKILKTKFHVKSCHAYAIVGSYKGFDVISAV